VFFNNDHTSEFAASCLQESEYKGRFTLEFSFTFEHPEDRVTFAASIPYSFDDLQRHISEWQLLAKNIEGW
jgi:hypothetical protein